MHGREGSLTPQTAQGRLRSRSPMRERGQGREAGQQQAGQAQEQAQERYPKAQQGQARRVHWQ